MCGSRARPPWGPTTWSTQRAASWTWTTCWLTWWRTETRWDTFISCISRVYFHFLSGRRADRCDRMSNKQGICNIQSRLLVLSLLVQALTYWIPNRNDCKKNTVYPPLSMFRRAQEMFSPCQHLVFGRWSGCKLPFPFFATSSSSGNEREVLLKLLMPLHITGTF